MIEIYKISIIFHEALRISNYSYLFKEWEFCGIRAGIERNWSEIIAEFDENLSGIRGELEWNSRERVEFERNSSKIWAKFERNLSGIWAESEGNSKEIWGNLERIWSGIWGKYAQALREILAEFERNVNEILAKFEWNVNASKYVWMWVNVSEYIIIFSVLYLVPQKLKI